MLPVSRKRWFLAFGQSTEPLTTGIALLPSAHTITEKPRAVAVVPNIITAITEDKLVIIKKS